MDHKENTSLLAFAILFIIAASITVFNMKRTVAVGEPPFLAGSSSRPAQLSNSEPDLRKAIPTAPIRETLAPEFK